MNSNSSVPFYSNTKDDTHCYQAALKMVLKHFKPEEKFTWSELEKLTAKTDNLWTWPTQGLINLHKMGFEVISMDDFDIKKFIKTGGNYLVKRHGEKIGKIQIANSNIVQERKIYREFLKLGLHKKIVPSLEDIKKLLKNGYLLICTVNSRALNNKPGYVGHFVVVFDYDKNNFYIHDPGLPPIKNRKISHNSFMKAWASPNKNSKNIKAFKLTK